MKQPPTPAVRHLVLYRGLLDVKCVGPAGGGLGQSDPSTGVNEAQGYFGNLLLLSAFDFSPFFQLFFFTF